MVLAGRLKLKSFQTLFSGGHLFVFVEYLCNRSPKIKTKNFVFVEYLCNRSPKIKTKNIKKNSLILAIVNHWNWLDDSPPLTRKNKSLNILLPYIFLFKIKKANSYNKIYIWQ